MQRGRIHNPGRAGQLRDFSGLRFGTITPTDIDGLIDFDNRLFVWIEAKTDDAEMPNGQRLALERVVNAISETRRTAVVLEVTHSTPPDRQIDMANCQVTKMYWHGKWRMPTRATTCRRAIEDLLQWANIEDN